MHLLHVLGYRVVFLYFQFQARHRIQNIGEMNVEDFTSLFHVSLLKQMYHCFWYIGLKVLKRNHILLKM